jgi:hypothetical protein
MRASNITEVLNQALQQRKSNPTTDIGRLISPVHRLGLEYTYLPVANANLRSKPSRLGKQPAILESEWADLPG